MAYNFFIYADDENGGYIQKVHFERSIPSEGARRAVEKHLDIKVKKIRVADNKHLCGYCYSIVNGTDEDVLCNECRELFGHSLFSEL